MRILALDIGKYKTVGCEYEAENGRHRDAAARIQIDNRQLEIGNEFTLPPLATNDLLCRASAKLATAVYYLVALKSTPTEVFR